MTPAYGEPFNVTKFYQGVFIPNCLLQAPTLNSSEKLLMGLLFQLVAPDGTVKSTKQKLGEHLNWSIPIITKYTKSLKQKRFINILNMGKYNSYTFIDQDIYDLAI